MKKCYRSTLLIASALILLLLAAMPVTAEEQTGSMEALRDAIQADKKAYISEYLQLTDAEGKEFWPYYNSYQFDLQKVNERLIKLINQRSIIYMEQWESKEALQQHIQSSIYSMILNAMELAAESPQICFHEVSKAMGLELIETLRAKGEETGNSHKEFSG